MFQNVWHSVALDLRKKIKQGHEAPSRPVVSLSGKDCFPLLKMAKPGRPLVLNFGSCTCPILMSQLDEFHKMVQDFSQVADFCVVYIEEAHPSDGWALQASFFNLSVKVEKACPMHILHILNTVVPFEPPCNFSLRTKFQRMTNPIKFVEYFINLLYYCLFSLSTKILQMNVT